MTYSIKCYVDNDIDLELLRTRLYMARKSDWGISSENKEFLNSPCFPQKEFKISIQPGIEENFMLLSFEYYEEEDFWTKLNYTYKVLQCVKMYLDNEHRKEVFRFKNKK